jgi:hypothetical protein
MEPDDGMIRNILSSSFKRGDSTGAIVQLLARKGSHTVVILDSLVQAWNAWIY